MLDRILSLMKEKNLSPSQFADEIGVQRSGMSHLISGRNKPSLEFIMKVLQRFPDVKPEYLLYGRPPEDGKTESFDAGMEPVTAAVQPNLFDQPAPAEIKPEPKPVRPVSARKERQERKIEKIVVLYDDKTFREYEPE